MTVTRKQPRRRHPALVGVPPGTFSPEAIGKVRGYPKDQAAYDRYLDRLASNRAKAIATGRMNRRGVPNGFRGQKPALAALRDQCAGTAWEVTTALWGNSMTPEERLDPEASTTDEARAAVALAGCIAITLNLSECTALRLAAMRTVLEYCLPRPKGGHRVELPDALGWLNGLVEAGNAAVG